MKVKKQKYKFKIRVKDEEKEAFTRMEYKPVNKLRGSTRQLDLPNESMCSPRKKGEEDSWESDVFCPTRSKKDKGRI